MMHIGLSKRERYVFGVTIIFIIGAFSYNLLFEPAFNKWQFLNREAVAKKVRFEKSIRLLKNRDSIIKEYNRYARATKNVSRILSYIESLADSLGIKTSNIRPGQAIEKGLYKEYNIELQIEGRFSEIMKFLSELIKPPTFVTLKKFDLRIVQENPDFFKGTIILSKIII